jgi:hypothetical protein
MLLYAACKGKKNKINKGNWAEVEERDTASGMYSAVEM